MATGGSQGRFLAGMLCISIAPACGAERESGGGEALGGDGAVEQPEPSSEDGEDDPSQPPADAGEGPESGPPLPVDGGGVDGTGEMPLRVRVPSGTLVTVAADDDVSTSTHIVGDPVVARVVRDVVDPEGAVLLPAGVLLLGRVAASSSSGGPGERPVLDVYFETLSAPGYEVPIEGEVVSRMLMLDPVLERARGSVSGSSGSVAEVPGFIPAGSPIVVQTRAPFVVPAVDDEADAASEEGTEAPRLH
ncbi:MAG: hypothetical protein J4F34_02035 [Gemmatimonadetes bacterium]|nr:hypothetical protein [Gemmatimonadota bacterium]